MADLCSCGAPQTTTTVNGHEYTTCPHCDARQPGPCGARCGNCQRYTHQLRARRVL